MGDDCAVCKQRRAEMYLELAHFGRVWVRGLQVRGVAVYRQKGAIGKIRDFAKFLIACCAS
jgi:hypothetical protein